MSDQNKEKKEYRVTKGSLILRIVVSVYLLYTVYQLSGSLGTTSGMDKIVVIIAMVIFTAVAVPLGGFSLKAMSGGEYAQSGAVEEPEISEEDSMEVVDSTKEEITQDESAEDDR